MLLADVAGVASVIHGCGNQTRVLRLLKFLCNCGVESHALLRNHLISSLMTVGCISDAEQVFDRLIFKNEQSWRVLIAGYIKYGRPHSAFAAFHKMRGSFVNPSEHTYAALLNSCTKPLDVKTGHALHTAVLVTGMETSFFIASSLVDMYAKCGFLEKSQKVFNMLSVRNIVTWNAIIAAYVRHSNGEKAIECFGKLQHEGLLPDGFSFVLLIKACSIIWAISKGIVMHVMVYEMELLYEDPYVCSSLVHMYVNCGMLIEAQEMFNEIHLRDAVSWNTVIGGYLKHGWGEEALQFFQLMHLDEISPTCVTYACSLRAVGTIQRGQQIHGEVTKKGLDGEMFVGSGLIDMYVKHGSLSHAEEIFDKFVHRTVVTWNSLIAGYVSHGYNKEALLCFDNMHVGDVSPSTVTFVCSLKACSNMGALHKGEEIHMALFKHGFENNVFIATALIDVYVNSGLLEKAQELFSSIPIQSLPVWNALIAGHAQFGEIGTVFEVLKQMVKEGIVPNPVTIVSLLNASSHSGLVDYAVSFVEGMIKSSSVSLIQEHFNCVVDILGRAGQVNKAIAVVKEMPFHPKGVVWHTVLSACRKWGDMECGIKAFDAIVGLDVEDDSAYTSMWNICMDADMVKMIEN